MAGNQSANYVPKQLIGLTWHKKGEGVAARMSPVETLSLLTPFDSLKPLENHMSFPFRHIWATWIGEGKSCRRDTTNLKTAKCTENLIKKGFSAWQVAWLLRLLLFSSSLTWPLLASIFPTFSSSSYIIFLRTPFCANERIRKFNL